MAYVAMNTMWVQPISFFFFLNGVCRHEQFTGRTGRKKTFLNGVCRHEHSLLMPITQEVFLNGVCRHEQKRLERVKKKTISKWRMSP